MDLSTPTGLKSFAREVAALFDAGRVEQGGAADRAQIVCTDGRVLELTVNRPRTRIAIAAILPEQAAAQGLTVRPITVTAQPRPRPCETEMKAAVRHTADHIRRRLAPQQTAAIAQLSAPTVEPAGPTLEAHLPRHPGRNSADGSGATKRQPTAPSPEGAAVRPVAAPLEEAELSTLANRQQARFTTGRGPVLVRRYARSPDLVRAAVRSGSGRDRAALMTLGPGAYPLAPAWLAAVAEAAPETADHRPPSASMGSVRLLAHMTPDHRNGVPRLSDGSVGWSVPGASARVWPDGRVKLRSTAGVEFAGRLEGSGWDCWKVAAVVDAGLRLLCAPEALHLTRAGEPSGWHRPYDRGLTGAGRERKGGQMYDASTPASCSCGWSARAPSQLAARAMAEQHLRDATARASG
ncbi:hypothetical protein ACF07T_39995 [Streptomyces sp. NPDC015184]|uniref:hypothetical protein n=1 Tax=Streptomyces sp. NPDC015184 TaxID=3364946 RepID=UPI0037036B04